MLVMNKIWIQIQNFLTNLKIQNKHTKINFKKQHNTT